MLCHLISNTSSLDETGIKKETESNEPQFAFVHKTTASESNRLTLCLVHVHELKEIVTANDGFEIQSKLLAEETN